MQQHTADQFMPLRSGRGTVTGHWLREHYKYLAVPRADSLVAGEGQYIPPAGNNHNHLQPPKPRKYLVKHPPALSNVP